MFKDAPNKFTWDSGTLRISVRESQANSERVYVGVKHVSEQVYVGVKRARPNAGTLRGDISMKNKEKPLLAGPPQSTTA